MACINHWKETSLSAGMLIQIAPGQIAQDRLTSLHLLPQRLGYTQSLPSDNPNKQSAR